MRRLAHRTIGRQARAGTGDLAWIEAHAELIAQRANDDVDDAQTSSSPGGGRGTDELTHPERHAARRLAGDDAVALAMADFVTALNAATRMAARARAAASRLITDPESHEAIRALALAKDKAGAGHCLNCGTYVPGIKSDRLRAGECEPCYRYRKDHHGLTRPRDLWQEEATARPSSAPTGG